MKQKRAEKLFCYYCDREFDQENILVEHQRAKHFTCLACHNNFSMAGELVGHMFCAHKETITEVPNAMPGRESTKVEIYGMRGIPPDVLEAHNNGEDEEDASAKQAKVERPGALNSAFPPPPYSASPPSYNPAFRMQTPRWQVSPQPKTWYPQLPVRTPFVPIRPDQQHARVPIQNLPSPQIPYYAPGFEPSFSTVQISPAPYRQAQPETFFPPTGQAQPHARFPIQNVPSHVTNIAPGFEPSFPTVPMSYVSHEQAQAHARFPIQNVPSHWIPDIAPGFKPSFPRVQMSPAPYGQAQPQAFFHPTRLAQPHARFPLQNVPSLKPDIALGFEHSPTLHPLAHVVFPSSSSSNASMHNTQILPTTAPSAIPASSATVLNSAVGQTPMSNIAMGSSYYTPSKGNPANSNSPMYDSGSKIEAPSAESQPEISKQDPVAQLEVNETLSFINSGNPANRNSPMHDSGPKNEAPFGEPRPVISNQDPAVQLEVKKTFSSINSGNPANSNSLMYDSGPKIEPTSIEPRPVISNQDPVAQLEVNETLFSINLGSPANINSHMYASGPNIGSPSIGAPPVITNQAPAAELEYNEVYFIWEDDDISMEERRLSLTKYRGFSFF